jgi:protein-S-isoprenylcysteine O-methyltransferase Ste14
MPKASKPSLIGEAPTLLPAFLPAIAIAFMLSVYLPGAMAFGGKLRGLELAAGIELACIGIVFWADAAVRLVMAWRSGTIAKTGAYGLCRHPIFSWWIFSVLPACAFIFDSWAFLVAALVLRIAAQGGADREEDSMVARFGPSYTAYQFQVWAFLPLPTPRPFRARRYLKGLAGFACLGLLALAIWFAVARPAVLGLGSSAAERRAALPGDELVAHPRALYTQAIDIAASPETVWAWLIQVGYHRAGWYNIDAINLLAGSDYFIDGKGSSKRIHPELQELSVGNEIGLAPGVSFKVTDLERGRLLLLSAGGPEAGKKHSSAASWVYALEPGPRGGTRLITRFRSDFPDGALSLFGNYPINDIGGAMIQQPAMLHGLKVRAEATEAGVSLGPDRL